MYYIMIGLTCVLLIAVGWIGYKVFSWLGKIKAWK